MRSGRSPFAARVQPPDKIPVEAASVSLIGDGGVREPIAEDDPVFRQRRANDLLDQLGPAGLVQKEFGQGCHPCVLAVQEQSAYLVADGRPAGIARLDHIPVQGPQVGE